MAEEIGMDVLRAQATFGVASVRIGSNLWISWARIALRQEARAIRARREGHEADDRAESIGLETEETIQAVSAVRHSFHNVWRDWRSQNLLPTREEKSWVPAYLTTQLPGDLEAWKRRVKDIVDWRDHVVHYDQESLPTLPHPAYPTNVAPLNAHYVAERATEAVVLMLDVYERVLVYPSDYLRRWSEERSHVLGMLRDFRAIQLNSLHVAPD